MTDYTRTPPGTQVMRLVAITSVDVINHAAVGLARTGNYINIDTSYYVGGIKIVPTVGDQWYITKQEGQWKLDHRVPFNDPNQAATIPTQGQYVVGSGQGPLELTGTQVNADAPLRLQSYNTAALPPSPDFGSLAYNTDTSTPEYFNGTWTTFGSGGGGSGSQIVGDGLTGTRDGANTHFTVSSAYTANTTAVYRNGLREIRGEGYTEGGGTSIVFSTAPLSDDELSADYRTL